MPRLLHRLALLSATALLAVTLTACDQQAQTAQYRIGFANLTEDIPFAVRVREGIDRAAREHGNVQVLHANNRLDGATALSNAENFITQNVNGVIEFQTDEQFGQAIMDRFNASNIPVIAIDIPMPGAVFFGVNNYPAGRMAGEGLGQWVRDNWDGEVDALLMLELPQSGPIPAARMQGQKEGLESVVGDIPESRIRRLDSKNTLEEARRLVADALTTLPNARRIAIVCINDDTALGAINAAQAAGREQHIAVCSVDASDRGREEIRRPGSRHVGSTASFPERYGDKLIPLMIRMIDGEEVPEENFTDHVFITAANVDEYYPDDPR
jgi:ribose transport system substrate-binding protein